MEREKSTKIGAGTAASAKKIIDQYDFINTKQIIVHIGTNDVEGIEDSPEIICQKIIRIGMQLVKKCSDATIFISNLIILG